MTMTLEQVRDVLKGWPTRTIERLSLHEADEMASAIVAYLTDRDEVTRTCRICGGQVDLSNAVKPDMMDTKGWHANARTVSDRYSSGSAQCKEPSQLINADLKSPVREYEKMNVEANEFTRDGIESQPDPVAQGEAVACMYPRIVSFKNVVRTSCPLELQDEIEGTVAWGPEVYVEDVSVVDKHGVVHHSYPLYAATPTGHRLVPVDDVTLREAAEEALDLLEHVDPEHGITTQLQRVLAAAPDEGGV